MTDRTDTGWVTFSRVTYRGRVLLVQKRDGESRTVFAEQPVCPWVATNGHSYPGGEKRTVTT